MLAVSGLHHHLIREGTRTRCGLVVESGEPREIQHFCLLLGYGAGAVNPYVAFATLAQLTDDGVLKDIDAGTAIEHYIKAANKGVLKVMTKMGISTLHSYRGAQIFEAIGLGRDLIERYFTWTASRIEGIGLDELAQECALRHHHAYHVAASLDGDVDTMLEKRRWLLARGGR